jgi:hypothetical protein
LARATSAEILARLAFVNSALGPIVFLACEISPVRPLPRYCYLPFDLAKRVHRDYLCRFAETGEIKLRFVSGAKTLDRTHRLTPYLRTQAGDVYAQGLTAWKNRGKKRDFDAALRLFERHARLPMFLERALLDDSLAEAQVKAKQAAETLPKENRELAAQIVGEFVEAFEPYYRSNGKALFEKISATRVGLSCIIDLRRMFAGNPQGLTEFGSDALAGAFSRTELENLLRLLELVLLLFKLPFREQIGGESRSNIDGMAIPEVSIPLLDMVQSMTTSGISKNGTSKLFELLGLEVGGQPGRPTKDYSAEYELKISGSSWTQVARSALAERLELQAEFDTRDYKFLNRGDQERLRNRIRQGVSAYVERTGKPAPSEADVGEQLLTEREKEIP